MVHLESDKLCGRLFFICTIPRHRWEERSTLFNYVSMQLMSQRRTTESV